ncbi:34290_t:CDS:2, partial [Gigaspora margarita]
MKDSTLMELLEEEKVLDKVKETSKQVVTELKLPKNLNPISALRKVQLDNTDYIDSGDKVGKRGIFLKAVEDPSWKLDIGILEDGNYYRMEELLTEYDKLFAWTSQELGRTNLVTHTIQTNNVQPIIVLDKSFPAPITHTEI